MLQVYKHPPLKSLPLLYTRFLHILLSAYIFPPILGLARQFSFACHFSAPRGPHAASVVSTYMPLFSSAHVSRGTYMRTDRKSRAKPQIYTRASADIRVPSVICTPPRAVSVNVKCRFALVNIYIYILRRPRLKTTCCVHGDGKSSRAHAKVY